MDSDQYDLYLWLGIALFLFGGALLYIRSRLQILRKQYNPEKFVIDLLANPIKRERGFELYLPVSDFIVPNTITCKNQTLSFDYEIPKCLVNSKHIEIGSILAVADLVTSVAILIHDKSHRAGVSISLSGQFHALQYLNQEAMLKQLEAGSIVHIDAHASKVGNNVGFSNFTMSTKDGQTLATVSHVKFLPSGYLWDTFGFLLPAVFYFLKKNLPGYLEVLSERKTPESTAYSVLNMKQESLSSDAAVFSIATRPNIINIFKAFHGGAIACAFQQASEQFIQASTDETSPKKIARYMNIEYLSPAKGHLAIEVDNHVTGDSPARGDDSSDKISKSVKIRMRENRPGSQKPGKVVTQARVIF